MKLRHTGTLLPLSLGLTALAQTENGTYSSLQAALASNSSLTQLTNLIQPYISQLANKTGITLFAPDNAGVTALLNTSLYSQIVTDPTLAQALLNYHIVDDIVSDTPKDFGWSKSRQTSLTSWLNETFFYDTLLTSPLYANVTGGQYLELTPWNGIVNVYSGLLTTSRVLSDAITYNNGEIYIVDRFLTIPPTLSEVAIAFGLTSWLGTTRALNLATTYDNYADLQVFIPTNAAFEAVAGNLATMSFQQLTDLIQYHAYIETDDNDDDYTAKTLQGSNITFRDTNNNTFMVNNAHVIAANIITANGFVYIIDQVLNPSNTSVLNLTDCDPGAIAFSNPTSASNAPFTNGIPTPTSIINTALATYTFDTSAVTACPAKSTGSSQSGSTPPDNPNSGSSNTSNSASSSSKKTNLGAIIGGVLGGLGGLLLIALLFWFCRRRMRQKQKQEPTGFTPAVVHENRPQNYNLPPGPVIAGVAGMNAYERQMAERATREQRLAEVANEERRLAEMASEERRLAELSSPATTATIRDFNELEAYEHYNGSDWVAEVGPQHYGSARGPELAHYGSGVSSGYGDGSGNRSGHNNSTTQYQYPSPGVTSFQPLTGGGDGGVEGVRSADRQATMSPEMAFLRGIQTSPPAPRRKPVPSSSALSSNNIPPVSPIQEGYGNRQWPTQGQGSGTQSGGGGPSGTRFTRNN